MATHPGLLLALTRLTALIPLEEGEMPFEEMLSKTWLMNLIDDWENAAKVRDSGRSACLLLNKSKPTFVGTEMGFFGHGRCLSVSKELHASAII